MHPLMPSVPPCNRAAFSVPSSTAPAWPLAADGLSGTAARGAKTYHARTCGALPTHRARRIARGTDSPHLRTAGNPARAWAWRLEGVTGSRRLSESVSGSRSLPTCRGSGRGLGRSLCCLRFNPNRAAARLCSSRWKDMSQRNTKVGNTLLPSNGDLKAEERFPSTHPAGGGRRACVTFGES